MLYQVAPIPFAFTGVDLKSDPSNLAPGKTRRAINVRPAVEYGLTPRQGTINFGINPVAE